MDITATILMCAGITSGELTPNITRNQIPPVWYSHDDGCDDSRNCGRWSYEPDEESFAVLNDLRRFGLNWEQAEAQFQIANKQGGRSDEVWCWNRPEVHMQWEAEVQYRRSAWVYLSLAMEPRLGLRSRLQYLDYLRNHIGEADYMAGIMPAPHPNYRVSDTNWKDRR